MSDKQQEKPEPRIYTLAEEQWHTNMAEIAADLLREKNSNLAEQLAQEEVKNASLVAELKKLKKEGRPEDQVEIRRLTGRVNFLTRQVNAAKKASQALTGFVQKTIGVVKQFKDENKKITAVANEDALTSIRNRRFVTEKVKGWVGDGRSVSKLPDDQVLCFIHFDLDGFKDINDTFGHTAGDRYLVHITKIISKELRIDNGVDVFARLGGDEFLIVFPAKRYGEAVYERGQIHDERPVYEPIVSAAIVAEKVRKVVAENRLDFGNGSDKLCQSVSCGCAVFDPLNDKKPPDVLQIADPALYHAKDKAVDVLNDAPKNRVSIDLGLKAATRFVRYSESNLENILNLLGTLNAVPAGVDGLNSKKAAPAPE